MIQGTTSDAGKSTVVTGLCRLLQRRGVKVAPFKPQNMALNSAVTIDGGEIGRAQAVQAQAAGLEPHTDMNPVLLKPNTDTGAQIIIHGKPLSEMNARQYHDYKTTAMQAVLASYQRLTGQYDTILVEGAGSPAEINLRDRDIANMGFAEEVDCGVVLVGDIDRGGVFAQLVGTLELLSASECRRVKGFIINRFRGDITLLQPGLEWLQRHTGKPVIGVLPYLQGFHLEAEDALTTSQQLEQAKLRVIVPALPRISNHTDFDPLRLHPQIDFRYIPAGQDIPTADLIILPGSKSVQHDLQWLRQQGWEKVIQRHLRYGGRLIGICGGFQMLGTWLHDPEGTEGRKGSSRGLGLLEFETTLAEEKQLTRVEGHLPWDHAAVTGYEIHMGISHGPALQRPAVRTNNGTDGVLSADEQILGTYLHGLFESQAACTALLKWAGLSEAEAIDYHAIREGEIDRLADTLEQHLDTELLHRLVS